MINRGLNTSRLAPMMSTMRTAQTKQVRVWVHSALALAKAAVKRSVSWSIRVGTVTKAMENTKLAKTNPTIVHTNKNSMFCSAKICSNMA